MPSRGYEKFDPEKRDAYLDLLREGGTRTRASRMVGVHRDTVATYRQRHPDFAAEESLAETEAVEEVEDALYQAAVSGNIKAIEVFLYNRAPERWTDRRAATVGVNVVNGQPAVEVAADHEMARVILLDPELADAALGVLETAAARSRAAARAAIETQAREIGP